VGGSIQGRVALITGASSGIGEGVALALAEQGARVFATGRRPERLAALKRRIEAAGGEAHVIAGDMTEEAFAVSLVDRAVRRFGRLDILVNAAGVGIHGKVEGGDVGWWRHSMDINLFATLITCAAAIPVMRRQGEGDIVNVSSTAGRRQIGGPYGTSKIALNSFHEGLRSEVGPDGIRCCIIEPGATTTEIWRKNPDPQEREAQRRRLTEDGVLLPEDIAACIVLALELPRRTNIAEMLIRPTIDVAPGVGL
jgi:NADP-dependent 3-hydroxy acid dehydrogenase YdfG